MKYAYTPLNKGWVTSGCETLSVGIYPVLLTKDGTGAKKGKVVVRVGGPSWAHEAINAKAEEVRTQLDADTYDGPKMVRV